MAIATLACLLVHGCESVDGGAVELSWKLRPASSSLEDKFVDCRSGKRGTNPVTKIRLDWTVGGVPGQAQWSCDDSHGVTGFDLPPGEALLSVTPLCADGPDEDTEDDPAVAGSYIAPAPERRTVNLGDTVSLGAVELIVMVSYCDDQPCICQ